MPSRANPRIVRNLPFDVTEPALRAIFLPTDPYIPLTFLESTRAITSRLRVTNRQYPRAGKASHLYGCGTGRRQKRPWTQVRAGFASDLVKDKQKRKKVRREEKKQAEAKDVHDGSGRIIAVDWALSKDRWEEKKDVKDETESDSQDENDNEDFVIDANHKETEEDVSDEEKAKARPSLPQPEAGTILFLRNLPFLATEDGLSGLSICAHTYWVLLLQVPQIWAIAICSYNCGRRNRSIAWHRFCLLLESRRRRQRG